MTDQSAPPKAQRIGVLATVVALHVALLLVFLASRSEASPPIVKSGAMSLIAISADVPAQRPPPPPQLPSKLVDEIRKLTAQAQTFEPDSTALPGPAGQCATLDLVSKAIVADPVAVAAVIDAPPETRSIAEAIVMWNAGWSSAAGNADSPLGAARAVVEQSLSSVEDSCLDEPITGPRLIPIAVADGQRTMFLVFGSGNWTWRQLVTDPATTEGMIPGEPSTKSWFEIDWSRRALWGGAGTGRR